MALCIQDLVELTGGRLSMAMMPPKHGNLAIIERIVFAPEDAGENDVYCRLAPLAGDIELAFLRGAIGVIAAGKMSEPWPGRFCLEVDDALAAMTHIVDHLLSNVGEDSFAASPELKVLQLCAARRADITRQPCERFAIGETNHRCRRQAA